MPKRYRSSVMASIHETAADLYAVDGMDRKTMRKFDVLCLTPIQAMTPKKIRALRARGEGQPNSFCRLSQCDSKLGKQIGARRKASTGSIA